ncbi:MAG TPA: hypothetical protein VF200_03745 [Woeseiaceae bacterium]
MKSRIAEQSERAMLDSVRRLTPEQRLNAFLEHCRLIASLERAGRRQPSRQPPGSK